MSFVQRHKKTLIHVAFWCVYASFFLYQITFAPSGKERSWSNVLEDFGLHMIVMIGISYINYFVFLPNLLRDKKLRRYLLSFLPVFIVLTYLFLKGKQWILADIVRNTDWLYSFRFGLNVYLSTLFIVVFVGLLRFVEDWFELEANKKEMENERLTSELRFLKAQINPHFLFNTLNNLYYLAFKQSPNTTEVIAKLSQMMRYMIYDSNHPRVPLDKEIEYMSNYISLEKMRLNDEVPISFEVRGNTEGVMIAPLIFITFLENAFKHGVSNTAKDSWVEAHIQIDGKVCTYLVANRKITEPAKTVTEKSGIGLQNLKRRLELTYPNRYDLNIEDLPDVYRVKLKLRME
ncbi:MAG: histidine kinase [Saprospiraceae bacterium]|nr:histidine kinase [Lewinella sp.]